MAIARRDGEGEAGVLLVGVGRRSPMVFLQSKGYMILPRGSFCKLAYAARVTPPLKIAAALQEFTSLTKETLEHIVQGNLDDRKWLLASLGIKEGGLGLRDGTRHAFAAFCSSFLNCRDYCKDIDRLFDVGDASNFAEARAARDGYDGMVGDDDRLDFDGANRSQINLSKALDKTSRRALFSDSCRDVFFRAHVSPVSQPGAGAWLKALPEDTSREWDDSLFDIALKRRCRVKVQEENSFCPCC